MPRVPPPSMMPLQTARSAPRARTILTKRRQPRSTTIYQTALCVLSARTTRTPPLLGPPSTTISMTVRCVLPEPITRSLDNRPALLAIRVRPLALPSAPNRRMKLGASLVSAQSGSTALSRPTVSIVQVDRIQTRWERPNAKPAYRGDTARVEVQLARLAMRENRPLWR